MYRGRPSRDGGPDRCWDGTPFPPRGRGHPDSDSTAVPMRKTDRDYCPLAMGFPEQGGMSVGPPDHRGPSRPSRMFWDSPSHHVGPSPGPGSGPRPCAGREAAREPPDRGRLRTTDVLIVPGGSEDLSDQVFQGTVTRDLRGVQANEESQEGALPGRIEAKVYGGDRVLMFGEDDSSVALMQGDRVQFNIVKSLGTQLRRATNIAVLTGSFRHTREAREMDESAGQEKGARIKKLPENPVSCRTPFEQRIVEVVEKKSTLAAPTVTKDKEKWKAVTSEILPQRTVVFEDVGTKLYDGVVIKPTVKVCNTKQIAGPESFPGRVLVRINGSDQELPFGARDLQTEMTVFEGDHVQFNISTQRSTGAERAINIEILPDTFQFTKETRDTGVVVDMGASCGFIKCKRSPRMFFCLSEVMGEDRLSISDEVEFTAVHVASDDQRDQAVRIKKLKNTAIPSSRSESETVGFKAREKKKMTFKFLKDSIGPNISNLKVNLSSFDEENDQKLFHRGEDHGDIDLQGSNPEYPLQQEKRSREFAEENDMVSEYGMDLEVLRRSSDMCRPTEWIEDTRLRGHSRSRSSEHSWSHSKKHKTSNSYWNLEFASKKRELEILEKHIAQKRTLIDRENSHQGRSGRTTEAGDFKSFRAVEDESYRKRFPPEAGGYMRHLTAPALPVKPILKKPNDPGMEPDFNNKNNGSEASGVKRSSNLSMQIERFLNTLNKGVDSGLLSTLLREAREESSVPETSRPVPQHKASKDSSGFSRILGIKHDLLSSEENWKGFLHIEDEEKFLYGEDASTDDLHPKSDMSKRQSPAAVKEEEGEDEDAAQNYDKIQTLLRTIGLDIGMAEVSKLAIRTQERLYGKKLKSKSCDSSDREPVKTGAATRNVVRQRSQTKSPESEWQPSERSITEEKRPMEIPVTSQGVGRTHHSVPPSPTAPIAPSFPPQSPAYSVPQYSQYQAFGPVPDGSAGHVLPMAAGWPSFPPPPDVPSPSFSDQLGGYPFTYQMGPPGQPLLHFLQGVSAGVPLPPWEPPVGFQSHSALGLTSPQAAPPGFPPLQLSGGLLSGYPPFPQNPLAGLPVYSQEPAGGPACGLAPASESAAVVSPAVTVKDKPSSRRYLRVINTVKISPTARAKSKESVIVEVAPACRQEKSSAVSPGPTGNSDPPQLSEGLKPKQKKRV
ncbi:CSDE1 protein, partial [Atractosteus spatula]|nr:CSDE1 protein [Atractosteus spatula]